MQDALELSEAQGDEMLAVRQPYWQQLGMLEKDTEKAAQYMRRAAHALTHRAENKR